MTRSPLRSVPPPTFHRPSRRVSPVRERIVCEWRPDTLDGFFYRHRVLAGLAFALGFTALATLFMFAVLWLGGYSMLPRGPR